ncbi:hypothetical protein ACFOGI_02160 [Virgibacillus xinjiangensis]|uniref:ComG operon protein 7 n=1 Tax=Virgibacillus xinjiangensis TaxID=393090 RepID=A0ABV7CS03_9BACI
MKRLLYFMNKKEHGFFLPYVLVIILVVLSGVASSIHAYKNTIDISRNHLEEIKIETLFQMGRAKVEKDLDTQEEVPRLAMYDFPDGNVVIDIFPMDPDTLLLHFLITTDYSQTELTNYMKFQHQ